MKKARVKYKTLEIFKKVYFYNDIKIKLRVIVSK